MLKENEVEISWFAPICDDDDILGSRNSKYKSSWNNTSRIVKTADELGYTNILCPHLPSRTRYTFFCFINGSFNSSN